MGSCSRINKARSCRRPRPIVGGVESVTHQEKDEEDCKEPHRENGKRKNYEKSSAGKIGQR